MVQFAIWNIIVIVCKSILFTVELLCNKPLNAVSEFLLGWVQPYEALELVLVIIIIPVIMNGLAFWIQDNFLKKSEDGRAGQLSYSTTNMKEPLM